MQRALLWLFLSLYLWTSRQGVAQNSHVEYIDIAQNTSVTNGFVSQLSQVIGQENLNTWKVSCAGGATQSGVAGFKKILEKNCTQISAHGIANTKRAGKVNMTINITRSGTNPIRFTINIVATKDLKIKKITKKVSDSFSIPANATPAESMAIVSASVTALKKKGESAKNNKVPSSPLWPWLESLFLPRAYSSEELLNFDDEAFNATLRVGEVLLYVTTYTTFKEIYKARDIQSLEEKILHEFAQFSE